MDKDHGFAAALRRADNEATEYQSWEILSSWCNLEKEWQRLPYALVGAAIAKAKPGADGYLGIGQAIAKCYEEGNQSDQAKARLRRLLACKTVQEACSILRPILGLASSKGAKIKYSKLLDDLIRFNPEYTLSRWAQDFYGRGADSEGEGAQ